MKLFTLLSLGALAMPASASLSISFTFDHTNANHASMLNDAWGNSTPNATKEAAFEALLESAADRWENAYVASSQSLSITIAVSWTSYSGTTLAKGGASFFPDGSFASNSLQFDNDGSSSFFVDLTPDDGSEWGKRAIGSQDFGGVSMNSENVFYEALNSVTRDNSDMLSTSIHEIGHTLGVLGGYPKYDDLDPDNDNQLEFSNGASVPYIGGHTAFTKSTPEYPAGGPDPFKYPHDGSSIGETYGPNVLSPSIVTGARKDITEVDLQLVGDLHGFDNIDFSAIPEPSSTTLLGLGSIALLLRRRK